MKRQDSGQKCFICKKSIDKHKTDIVVGKKGHLYHGKCLNRSGQVV